MSGVRAGEVLQYVLCVACVNKCLPVTDCFAATFPSALVSVPNPKEVDVFSREDFCCDVGENFGHLQKTRIIRADLLSVYNSG